jgi:hypothetical protein
MVVGPTERLPAAVVPPELAFIFEVTQPVLAALRRKRETLNASQEPVRGDRRPECICRTIFLLCTFLHVSNYLL